jgi:uncharacterized protein (TIGR02391 family)
MSDHLEMTFDPMTIEHLGVKMYSTLPPVLSELIANAHDANAELVKITLSDSEKSKQIKVEDNGDGMSFDEINKKFLKIGRNRRDDEGDEPTSKGRRIIGKKGLGKLSFFGIAQEIEIATRKEGKESIFVMRWEDIKKAKKAYEPIVLKKEAICDPESHGTTIVLRGIDRDSDFMPEDLATSISKIFIVDPSFQVLIQHNSSAPILVENDGKYTTLDKEIEWDVPADTVFSSDYKNRAEISGHLIATKKPIPPKTNMRGITLFSRRKLVNLPEYFSDSTSSHFFSYLTGWLEVDFIDLLPLDVISTNRQSLNWAHPEMAELREYLKSLINWLERDWRQKRAGAREKDLAEKSGVNVPDWFSKLPPEIRNQVEPVLQSLLKDSELPEEAIGSAARRLHEIVPEYPKFHWRNLHPAVQEVSKQYYANGDYYTAFMEAVKRYIGAVKAKTGSSFTDRDLLENVFSLKTPKLSVTSKFKKSDGTDFEVSTIENITEGHRMLVLGVWQACRCPVAHEEVRHLRDSGLFTEKDCLDALGLVSHLFARLDNSQPMP